MHIHAAETIYKALNSWNSHSQEKQNMAHSDIVFSLTSAQIQHSLKLYKNSTSWKYFTLGNAHSQQQQNI